MSLETTAIIQAVKIWKELLRRYPRVTTIASIIGGILMVVGLISGLYDLQQKKNELDRQRKENLSYTQQLDALNNVQGSLNNLIQFVETQKLKLKESEDLINSLKSEQERLKPVVEADRKTVEALLDLQSQKAQSNVWKERWIGFGLGILSSIAASLLIAWIGSVLRRRPTPPSPPAESTPAT